jgi:SH3-like domain-containing protein
MRRCLCLLLIFFIFNSTYALAKTGLPVPRYVSLRSAQVNLRVGPGRHYPIEWVFVRSSIPVEIISEFDNWRKIRDSEGSEGWVHQSMLAGTRFALITEKVADLRTQPRNDGHIIAKTEQDVLVKVLSCQGEWCRIQVEKIKGWVPKTSIWGVYPQEVF